MDTSEKCGLVTQLCLWPALLLLSAQSVAGVTQQPLGKSPAEILKDAEPHASRARWQCDDVPLAQYTVQQFVCVVQGIQDAYLAATGRLPDDATLARVRQNLSQNAYLGARTIGEMQQALTARLRDQLNGSGDSQQVARNIIEGYERVLGRPPSSDELRMMMAWTSPPRTAAEIDKICKDKLHGDSGELYAMVGRAYQKAFGRAPTPEGSRSLASASYARGATYQQLVTVLPMSAARFVAPPDDSRYTRPVPPPIPRRGNPPPVPNDNFNGSAFVVPWSGGQQEKCFGSVGAQCGGVAVPFTSLPFGTGIPSLQSDGSLLGWVSVGAIQHDLCCLDNPNGLHCSGLDPIGDALTNIGHMLPFANGEYPACFFEWKKAVYNNRDARNWQARFGSYSANSSDDLSRLPGRATTLFGIGDSASPIRINRNETRSSRRLMAPEGIALDLGDEAYCASGRFKQTFSGSGIIGDYGICSAPSR